MGSSVLPRHPHRVGWPKKKGRSTMCQSGHVLLATTIPMSSDCKASTHARYQ